MSRAPQMTGKNPRLERQQLANSQATMPSRVRGFSGVPVANRADAEDDPDYIDPKTGEPLTEKEKQERREKKTAEQREREKTAADKGTPVASPGSAKGGIGPMQGGEGDGVQSQDKLSRNQMRRKLRGGQIEGKMLTFANEVDKQMDSIDEETGEQQDPAKKRPRNEANEDVEQEHEDADKDEGDDRDDDQRARLSRKLNNAQAKRTGKTSGIANFASGLKIPKNRKS